MRKVLQDWRVIMFGVLMLLVLIGAMYAPHIIKNAYARRQKDAIILRVDWKKYAGQQNDALASMLPEGKLIVTPKTAAERNTALAALRKSMQLLEKSTVVIDVNMTQVWTRNPVIHNITQVYLANSKVKFGKLSQEQYAGPTTQQIRWAYDGDCIRYEEATINIGDLLYSPECPYPNNVQALYDGTYTYRYCPATQIGQIVKGAESPAIKPFLPTTALLLTWGEESLSKLLGNAKADYRGHQMIGGEDCIRVTIPQQSNLSSDIWCSPQHGYRVKRIACLSILADDMLGNRYNVYDVHSYRQSGDVWFPTEGASYNFCITPSGDQRWLGTERWKVDRFTLDVPDSVFCMLSSPSAGSTTAFQFPLGTTVVDMAHHKKYIAGQESKANTHDLSTMPTPIKETH